MDMLSQALASTHLQSSLLATLEMAAPWSIDFEQASGSPTFYVTSGEVWFHCPPEPPELLSAGDLVMVPRWDRCYLSSHPRIAPVSIREFVRRAGATAWQPGRLLNAPLQLVQPGAGPRCTILAMAFQVERPERHPLILGLPRRVLIRGADSIMGGLLEPALRFIANEAADMRPGYAVTSNRLAELLFIQIVRCQIALAPQQVSGMLRGLTEPGIGRALAAIHQQPATKWTIASLAAVAGMSRSIFAERFHALMGCTVLAYLTHIRVEVAREALAGGASIKTAAAAAGYASGTALNKAMKRVAEHSGAAICANS
jgi:AraC-like DNA-binding protein